MAGEDGGGGGSGAGHAGGPAGPAAGPGGAHASSGDHVPAPIVTSGEAMDIKKQTSHTSGVLNGQDDEFPLSPRVHTPNPFSRKNTSMDIDDYFSGPRDLQKHSKWPLFLQMHGSILPKMVVPLLWVGAWSSIITWLSLSERIPGVNLSISSILLTVTGFVVGLGLSFRNSTAYERYAEGRRYWSQLTLTCQSLARVYWVNTKEREQCSKEDLLAKITALNLLTAFAVALKHKLRFEPYTYYEDIEDLVAHLETYARSATQDDDVFKPKKPNVFKVVGEHLGISFAASNPRKIIKKAQSPLGNLPLEILTYLAAYTDEIIGNGQLPIPMTQTMAYNGMQALNDVMTGTERVLTTPLPLAYTISISQITWAYVMLLPFQLLKDLKWVTIPAAVCASYIILGLLFIGREIENPFGNDVNDLPLELYCQQIVQDLETVSARPPPRQSDWVQHPRNKLLFPYSESGYRVWAGRSEAAIRQALRSRPHAQYEKETVNSTATTVKVEDGTDRV
ncbi:hypothetical protein PG985_002771 [Apiospora marii]|uniref:uncharacterized protein n=1 Tax=Apiospora marii TaxID=335849 RepID=UPI0031325B4F